MTDKPTVDKSVNKTTAQAMLPSVSPEKPPVDKTVADKPATFKATYVAAPQHDVPAEVDPLLVTMLCWPRSHNSPEELAFTGWLMDHITNTLLRVIDKREEGSFSVSIPMERVVDGVVALVPSTTLFSCHVDTVDSKMVDPHSRKKLTYDPSFGTIALDSQSPGSCLGADDSAGIWLMLKMIEAGTPGTYLFHRGEECGGVSAKANAAKQADWLSKFQCAIAFDRKDTGDIVTVQGGARCASPKFASRLGGMLDVFGFRYMESTTGSYTDVRDYRGLIAEVVNLSCGYDSAHSRNETLDYAHLAAMSKALPKVEWEALPIDRDPKAKDPAPAYTQWKGSRGFDFSGKDPLFDDEERQWGARAKAGKKTNGTKKPPFKPLMPVGKFQPAPAYDPGTSFSGMTMEEIRASVEDDPDWAVEGIVDLVRQNAKLAADNDMLTKLLGL